MQYSIRKSNVANSDKKIYTNLKKIQKIIRFNDPQIDVEKVKVNNIDLQSALIF